MSPRPVPRWLPALGLAFVLPQAAVAADWSGAVTLVGLWGPEYQGARDAGFSARPGFFVRYGRVSLSSGGGFAARREDAELRGLGIELAHDDRFDLSLGLRTDGGRSESDSPGLAGMGDVKRTLRARIGGTWRFAPGWQLSGNWTVDAFNRGGGNLADLKLQHDWQLTPQLSLSSSAAVSVGGDRYMQTWFGVTAEQSARSGYAEYDPRLGLRDLSLAMSLKAEVGHHWVFIGGPGLTWMLGPAAKSPLVQRRLNWSASAGVGYRF